MIAYLVMFVCILCATGSCNVSTQECTLQQQDISGVIFKGNNFKPDQRTSILIPSYGQRLEMGGNLEVSFDLKIRHKGDHYGNICTIVVDNKPYISLILTNTREVSPAICMVAADRPLTHIDSLQELIYSWQRVNLKLERSGEKIVVSEGNTTLLNLPAPGTSAEVSIFFGRSLIEEIPSIDVAPCELKDICIVSTLANHEKRVYDFRLDKSANDSVIVSTDGNLTGRISNPVWIANTHSHWDLVSSMTFDNRVFPVYNAANGNLFLVTSNQVTRINLLSNRTRSWRTTPQVMTNINNQFIAVGDNSDERLIFYDIGRTANDVTIDFDFGRGDWCRQLTTTRYLEYSHHNRLYDRRDSTMLRMFGYGHHRYSAGIDRINIANGCIDSVSTLGDVIPPRYMAAVGMSDSLIYVYGGVGNLHGDQEYGTTVYNDMYKIDPVNMNVSMLWSLQTNRRGLVPAQTLVIDESRKKAIMLMFSPFSSETFLSLKELDIETGELVDKADSIFYSFNDVKSWADLLMVPTGDELYAIIVSYDQDKVNYDVKLYNISMPILDNNVPVIINYGGENRMRIVVGIFLLCCIIVVLVLICRGRVFRKNGDEVTDDVTDNYADVEENPKEITYEIEKKEFDAGLKQQANIPGMYILNDFMAIGADGTILTDQFSPILRQLLVLIAVYSVQRQNGISNSELKEFLWSDKSQESFVNNRSVNIRKIRMLLEKIGNLDILSSNGVWRLQAADSSSVDFFDIMAALDECDSVTSISDTLVDKVIKYARRGPLFPYMHYYWLDSIKGQYSDRIIRVLNRILDAMIERSDYKRQIVVCDILLAFDSIDEKAVRTKCIALIRTKRIGMAHSSFKQFVREYEAMMNEPWTETFEQYIKNQI